MEILQNIKQFFLGGGGFNTQVPHQGFILVTIPGLCKFNRSNEYVAFVEASPT